MVQQGFMVAHLCVWILVLTLGCYSNHSIEMDAKRDWVQRAAEADRVEERDRENDRITELFS